MAWGAQFTVQVNAEKFAKTAKRICPKLEVCLINSDDITRFRGEHDIEKHWDLVAPLPGTLNVHSVAPVSWGQVQYRTYSFATESALHTLVQNPYNSDTNESSAEHEPQNHPCEPMGNIKTGDCLLITYKGKRSSRKFVGLVTDYDSEGLEVQFLRRNDELGLVYILPTKENKSWVARGQVIQCLNPFLDNRGRYHFKEAVLAE